MHHWKFFLLVMDESDDYVMEMPDKYRREMLADWRGAGIATNGPDIKAWYIAHSDRIQLHPNTRKWIEGQLNIEPTPLHIFATATTTQPAHEEPAASLPTKNGKAWKNNRKPTVGRIKRDS